MERIVILDRDGVLDEMLTTPVLDSPQKLSEIKVFPWVPSILK
jgi:hypothetical protein